MIPLHSLEMQSNTADSFRLSVTHTHTHSQHNAVSHLPANSVVVKSHPGVNVSVRLTGVQEVLGEAFPKLHVGTAAAPFPGVLGAESVGGKLFHHAVHHAFPPVDGLQLETVEFDPERLLIPSAFLITAAGLQLAHGAGVGHSMHHSGRCDGICKRTFSETCQRDNTRDYSGKPCSNVVYKLPWNCSLCALLRRKLSHSRRNRTSPDVWQQYQYIPSHNKQQKDLTGQS